MYSLAVITPCSRPENLGRLFFSLRPGLTHCRLAWHIVYDADDLPASGPRDFWVWRHAVAGGEAGKRQVNLALEHIDGEAWVWVLDDDNLAREDMFPALGRAIAEQPDKRGFLMAQHRGPGRVVGAETVQVGVIDQAQYVLRRDLIGDRRYEDRYEADGLFIADLVAEHGDEIGCIDEALVNYNRLRW